MIRTLITLAALSIFSHFCHAQIDQEGQVLTGVSLECNNENIAAFEADIEDILTAYTFTDNNTGECNGNLAYIPGSMSVISPYPQPCDGMVEVEMDYDCDGSTAGPISVMIVVEDTTPPDMSNVEPMSGTNIGTFCPGEIEDMSDLMAIVGDVDLSVVIDNCTDFSQKVLNDFVVIVEEYDGDCGELGFVEWEIEDDCGNVDPASPYRLEWDLSIGPGVDQLDWELDPADYFPPDITMSMTDALCTNEFDPCLWTDENMNMWQWEAIENVVWSGGCDVRVVYNYLPCQIAIDANEEQIPQPSLLTATPNSVIAHDVCINIIDDCDATDLEYCFEVVVKCGNCGSVGNIYCETCEDADPIFPTGCKLCDPIDLAEGYQSCNPECPAPCNPISDGSQPSPLCGVSGNNPNNMSWFAFVASSSNLTLNIQLENCSLNQGVQLGIYDSCDWDNCVIWSSGCDNMGGDYSGTFNVGQTYYLFIDGCNGDDCLYTVTMSDLLEIGLPEMDAITAYSDCSNTLLTDDPEDPAGPGNASVSGQCFVNDKITACPGEEITFNVIHQGDLGNALIEHREACGNYRDDLNMVYFWSTSWAGVIEHSPTEDGGGACPPLTMPEEEGVYEICLDAIVFECDPKFGPVCLEVHVVHESSPRTFYFDLDGDGYGAGAPLVATCEEVMLSDVVCIDGDCDDTDPDINPGVADYCCDGIDNDCDGMIDEDFPSYVYPYITTTCGVSSISYSWPTSAAATYEATLNDVILATIVDGDFEVTGVGPGDVFIFCVIATYPDVTYTECVEKVMGIDNDGDGVPAGEDCDDNDPNNFPGNTEVCDGRDNDCDGLVDEGFISPSPNPYCISTTATSITFGWLENLGESSYDIYIDGVFVLNTNEFEYTVSSLSPATTVTLEVVVNYLSGCPSQSETISCTTLDISDADGDGFPSDEDCDDNNANVFPGNPEICDGWDNDCNGTVDDGLPVVINYLDDDGDGFGLLGTEFEFCELLDGFTEVPGDCDDNDPNNYPGNTEVCDGRDNDCDGLIDNDLNSEVPVISCASATDGSITVDWQDISEASIYYIYVNGNFRFSSQDSEQTITGLMQATSYLIRVEVVYSTGCAPKSSEINCTTTNGIIDSDGDGVPAGEDCDDNDPDNYPGNTEICDDQDNDCDGEIDEGLLMTYYSDNDGDGYGVDGTGFQECMQPPDTTTEAGDCDDTDPDINPGAQEIPNNTVDENCDGVVEIIDLDGDGWNSDLDCDDTNAAINPGAMEIPGNGIDEDCDGEIDPSSISEIDGYTIQVYPNPVGDYLNVDCSKRGLSYKLMTTDGKEYATGVLSDGKVDVSEMAKGIMIIRIFDEHTDAAVVFKLMKL